MLFKKNLFLYAKLKVLKGYRTFYIKFKKFLQNIDVYDCYSLEFKYF